MKKSELTRLHILQKSFELIYAKGYQNASIDDILATTQVTKGAFYYHFKNKDEMGIAIINELLEPILEKDFFNQIPADQPALDTVYLMVRYLLLENDFLKVEYGCPAANFTQEMTPWNENFSKALNTRINLWLNKITTLITQGIEIGQIRTDVEPVQVTLFVISSYWGIRNFGKLENSTKSYITYLKELKKYLDTLS